MSKIIKIKNTTGSNKTYQSQLILPNEYYQIELFELTGYISDNIVFTAIANGDLVVNNGTIDLINAIDGWNWLSGDDAMMAKSEIGNKVWVHESAKPELPGKHFYTQWAGAGDVPPTDTIGNGQSLDASTVIGQPTTTVDVYFDYDFGDIWIHEAYAMWELASFGDEFNVDVMAGANIMQTSVNLDYIIESDLVKIAPGGAGTGTHGFSASPILSPACNKTTYGVCDGFWNYDTTNGLTPSAGIGKYNISTVDVTVNRFINRAPVMGNNYHPMRYVSSDTAQMIPGYFLRLTLVNNSNTVWHLSTMMNVYRERTI